VKPVIRAFTTDDYGSVAAVLKSVYVEYPWTAEELRFNDEHDDPRCLRRRWVVDVGDHVVGTVEYSQHIGMYHPQKFLIDLAVRPEDQGKHVGAALYDHLLAELAPLDPISLRVWNLRADMARGIRFLEDRGFVESQRSWESRLDVLGFDPAPYAGIVEKVMAQGISIESIASLGGDPERNRKVHDLDVVLNLDVPHPEPITPVSYEFFVKRVMNDSPLIPEAWFIALHEGRYVGSSNHWRTKGDDGLYVGLTGVCREYRRRGIALALKLRGIAWARENGYGVLKTWNESNNRPMLSINERLGFVKQPVWISWLKVLRTEEGGSIQ
jgi:mycothiol synthase